METGKSTMRVICSIIFNIVKEAFISVSYHILLLVYLYIKGYTKLDLLVFSRTGTCLLEFELQISEFGNILIILDSCN